MKTELTVENKIAAFINAGTDFSERKIAERFEVPRSVVRRVKENIEKYTMKPVEEEFVAGAVKESEIPNIEKLLASNSAHKKPSEISLIVYRQTKGDFIEFGKRMTGKSKAYIRDQFLRCTNKINRGSE
ncbi:hypothetical protein QM190_06850 [Enterobacter hormaechei]|uniref:hypothetical protein n=1 Tax=Enterobacter cloacae complex TaxID=354276 RepID=UPI0007935534|nr:hypothetical protein [Enterobacter hormaechei]ELJ9631846.1 hypothetical protein [Enterobacter hormaechei]MBJ6511406.1 hypothetical protein [Enterobacter hormaechei]MBJ6608687.1 hypothetical protein [Enterobacter hormaechei]MBK4323813.1 hypothetical protein [Enterobacter hormaechei]MBK4340600.1 hypothetical protein [Enterobacter hormaechei]